MDLKLIACAFAILSVLSCTQQTDAWWGRSSKGSGSSSSGSGGRRAHDIKTKSGLTKLFNQRVTKIEKVERPKSGSSGSGFGSKVAKFFGKLVGVDKADKHSAVRVTTESGKQYLIHKGKGYGEKSQTVVVDAKHMSKAWKTKDSRKVTKVETVGNIVKKGGAHYNPCTSNCHHASDKMFKG